LDNESLEGELESCRVTTFIEQRAGVVLWGNLTGPEIDKAKNQIRTMWSGH